MTDKKNSDFGRLGGVSRDEFEDVRPARPRPSSPRNLEPATPSRPVSAGDATQPRREPSFGADDRAAAVSDGARLRRREGPPPRRATQTQQPPQKPTPPRPAPPRPTEPASRTAPPPRPDSAATSDAITPARASGTPEPRPQTDKPRDTVAAARARFRQQHARRSAQMSPERRFFGAKVASSETLRQEAGPAPSEAEAKTERGGAALAAALGGARRTEPATAAVAGENRRPKARFDDLGDDLKADRSADDLVAGERLAEDLLADDFLGDDLGRPRAKDRGPESGDARSARHGDRSSDRSGARSRSGRRSAAGGGAGGGSGDDGSTRDGARPGAPAPKRRKLRGSWPVRLMGSLVALGMWSVVFGALFVAGVFAWFARDLPSTDQLASYEPPTLSRVYSGDGALMAEFARERRLFTPIDEVPDLIRHAFISAEDKNFFEHKGVDGVGLLKAMVDNVRRASTGQSLRGASTITQQVVKNFLLSGERAITRKIKEALLANRLETALTKDQILELYLNEIFLGSNSYGVTAATARYFGKRLEDLEPHEAAYLAALPKAPSTYHPVRRKAAATSRRNYVLREMKENGYLTQEQFDEAVAQPLWTLLDKPLEQRRRVSLSIDYFSEEIRRQLVARMGEDKVYGGGLAIRATVDPEKQDLARRVLQKRLFDYSVERGYIGPIAQIPDLAVDDETAWRKQLAETRVPRDVAPWKVAVVLLVGQRSAQIGIEGFESDEPIYLPFSDVREWARRRERPTRAAEGPLPETPADVWEVGDVIYVQEATNEDGSFDRWSMRQIPNVNGAVVAMHPSTGRVLAMQGGFSYGSSVFNRATQAQRQPGSSFKPFVYAAALESGYRPNTIILDAPFTEEQVSGELWKPQNYSGRFYGPSPLRWGIEKSQNLMTVRVANDIGLENVAQYAETFGVYDQMPPLLSYTLGAGETTLMKMVASYAMFVNGGKRIEPTLIDRIQDRHGETIFRHDDRICTECQAADWYEQPEPYVPDDGEQVLDPVTAYQLVSMMQGVAIRGTASRLGQNLNFPVGGKTGTTNDAKDAWFIGFSPDLVLGCFIGFDSPRSLGDRQSGGKLCAPVFEEYMAEVMKDRPPLDFARPADVVLQKIDAQTGACVPESFVGAQYIWEAFRRSDDPCALSGMIGQQPGWGVNPTAVAGGARQGGGDAAFDPTAPQRPQRPSVLTLEPGGFR